MAGFDSIIVLLGLLVIPALYLIYNQMIKKRRKAAIKFSNLMFVISAICFKRHVDLSHIGLCSIGFFPPFAGINFSSLFVNKKAVPPYHYSVLH